jgi:serine protease Do
MTDQLREYFGVEAGKGALVSGVSKNSAAERAGLRAGDVLLSIDGQAVTGAGDVARALGEVKGSKTVQVEVVRNRGRQTLSATVEEARPGNEE